MKRYTTKKNYLPYSNSCSLEQFLGQSVSAYSLPKSQSMAQTWSFCLHFIGRPKICFSSLFTVVRRWEEVGHLKIVENPSYEGVSNELSGFTVTSIAQIIYEDNEVYSEAGIAFTNIAGQEFVILPGVSPGSVTIKAEFLGYNNVDSDQIFEHYIRKVLFSSTE